uniref:DOP1 leucine zipper like protein B n=1 Tax=Gadus morhua TaxID=8049 RepID=A0A8C4ZED7_GADMO
MDPEEADLQNDYRYRSYGVVIEKALRSFESSSEWADLISSLGKLNKALQSNLRYSLLPKRLIIGKRLAQCLHPALPSGVHLKALETYEVIFKIIGTKWLAKDLFIYSSGLFPLLGHAAMAVKPVLLMLYERYYLPLQRALLPSLQAFITGLLPGMEEGLEVFDRTDALLLRLSLLVGQQVFYGALWGSVLVSPLVRLPASLFIVTHFDRGATPRQQSYMLGYNHGLVVKSVCLALQDSNVLVQRNMLEILLHFFPFDECLKSSVNMSREDMVTVVSAATLTLLRRDMSLNRRLYTWLLGTDTKRGRSSSSSSTQPISSEDQEDLYFPLHSRDLLIQVGEALVNILKQKDIQRDPETLMNYLRPFRVIVSLLDKPEIGPVVISSLLLEVVRSFYSYCREMIGEDSLSGSGWDLSLWGSKMKENKNASEIIKAVNLLVSSMDSVFLWDHMTRRFSTLLRPLGRTAAAPPPTVTEISTLIMFLLEVLPLELHADIQSQFLPEMLGKMLAALHANMAAVGLVELTQGLRACFKVLGKIQMPVAYMDLELSGCSGEGEAEPGEGVLAQLRSEDSGLGVSASPSEQQLLLRAGAGEATERARLSKEGEDVWRKGGSQEEVLQPALAPAHASSGQKAAQIVLSSSGQKAAAAEAAAAGAAWADGFMPRSRSEISESCRQAFAAACHLLLECTTFPVYLSEGETQPWLLTRPPPVSADREEGLPVWLRSLMILCCSCRDYGVQHTAIASFLELVNHSQSLALVIQDKHKRYQSCNSNPLSGRLQMVTVPPVLPATLARVEEETNFYQRVAQVLWGQLDTERREQHISCVELYYRLHCLAPTASVCEDTICQALLHKDKAVRLEALHRFSILWHLTREMQSTRVMSLNRSFDRSLCVVLDSLGGSDGSVSAAAQCWLVRALSLDDVIRVLEPILLLLLHPDTQRCSIQNVKQNLTALSSRSRGATRGSADPGEAAPGRTDLVDREALWKLLESDPEATRGPNATPASRSESVATAEDSTEEDAEPESEHTDSADTSGAQVSVENSSSSSGPFRSSLEEGAGYGLRRVESEHTQVSDSLSSEEEDDQELEAMARSRLLKQEREKREAIDSLFRHALLYSEAGGWQRLLQGLGLLASLLRSSAQRPLVDALSLTSLDTSSASHLNLVSNLLQRHQQAQDGGGFYGRLLSPASSPSAPPSLLLELLMSLCLRFLRSHYPSYLSLGPHDLQGNREVQVQSAEVLVRLVNQLGSVAQRQGGNGARLEPIRRLLAECRVQQYALLSLSASMYVSQRGGGDRAARSGAEMLGEKGGLSEESLVNLGAGGGGQEQYPLQVELLKLIQALITLENSIAQGGAPEEPRDSPTASTPLAREWQTAVLFQQSIKAAQYVQNQPITAQGMFVSAAARALQPQYGYAMHPHWVSLLCSSLPFLGRSLGIILAPIISQICVNLDDLVKVHEHEGGKVNQSTRKENIAPDYPLTLLEGLTTITHHCLLDHRRNKNSLTACDPADLRNARSAVLEGLPHMLSSMTLLWAALKREETVGSEGAKSSRQATSSVYFRSTKILRQRILEFLIPLTGQYGVQIMASVGSVWLSRKTKRRHRNKVLPVLSESRLIVVDLVKSLSSMRPETVLHLVKEVVKKPHQIKAEQKSTLVDIPMLEFSYAYVLSLSPQTLQENVAPLLSLLRESVQLNLAPPGHFLLLGILDDFVNRLPNLDNKKDSRDLQEVTQRVLEAVGGVAGSSLEQTSWLSRNLEVKNQPQICPELEDSAEPDDPDAEASTMVSASAPSVYSVQALALLAEILAPLLDMVYRSDEKEKAVPLITRIMYYVFPYLKNHSAYNMPSFGAGAQLLSSLSGYAYTKRAWRKEAFELFMDPLFFTMEASCALHWRSIIDHLLTHEKTMFKDLMSMQSSSLKLFPSAEQKPMLLKRQAFAMFSGEVDQYHLFLPLIQERLSETLRVAQTPAVSAQTFLMFRVLLLRISPQHLTSLWPIMVTELIRIFSRLHKALQSDNEVSKLSKVVRGALARNNPPNIPQQELDMYLSACKFLDTSLAFPPDKMPLFQMYRWAFVPEVDVDRYSGPENALLEGEQECKPHVLRILEGMQLRHGVSSTKFPLLRQHSLPSITHLVPFFQTLCCSFQGPSAQGAARSQPIADYPAASSDGVLKRLEAITEEEFLDPMES